MVRVDLGVMPMKRYPHYPKDPGLASHSQMLSGIFRTLNKGVFLPLHRDAVCIFTVPANWTTGKSTPC